MSVNEFVVYAEKEAFDEITFNGNYPHLKSIFINHSLIFLNLTKGRLQENIDSEGELFYYIHAYSGAKIPEAYPQHFENIYDDPKYMLVNPRSIYFLNISESEANNYQRKLGIIVQSSSAINDEILKGGAHYELSKDTILNGKNSGWKVLFDFPKPPSNSIVITDDWLFKNEENGEIIGVGNVISLLNALLPHNLEVDYHILIITDDQGRPQLKCEKIVVELRNAIISLRSYPIVVEVVFTEAEHKRKAILNYLSITCDKGFAMFRLVDLQTVRDDNDFRYEKLFNRTEKHEGSTVLYSDSLILKRIHAKCTSVKEYIKNLHEDPNRRILGDCNADKSLKNRLISDI